jgi:CrcB protein
MAPTDERNLALLLVIAVALGGAAGALARYGLDRLIEHHVVTVLPWSTFTINVTGCFLAGLAVAALVDQHDLPAWVRTGVVVGFLGAYTTFSTFAQESRDLFVGGHVSLAVVNATASVVVGMLAVAAGTGFGRML